MIPVVVEHVEGHKYLRDCCKISDPPYFAAIPCFLVKPIDFLGDVVGDDGNFPSQCPRQVHKNAQESAAAEFPVKGRVGIL